MSVERSNDALEELAEREQRGDIGVEITSISENEHRVDWTDGSYAMVYGTWAEAYQAGYGRCHYWALARFVVDLHRDVASLRQSAGFAEHAAGRIAAMAPVPKEGEEK